MKVIFEKEVSKLVEGKTEKTIEEVKDIKEGATHKHICYHDEGKGRPCKRIKL